tara:strand:+ start:350 stop:955 length:606 start_codon:yes stop_codon:yes gene_type:complete
MLTKVRLYGDLADFVGHKELEAVIHSTADAIKFLICNFPKVEAYMAKRYYKVLVSNEEITEKEIAHPIGKSEISIVPVITGSGGNTGRIIAGVALIGLAVATGGTSLTFGAGGFGAVEGAKIGFSVFAGNLGGFLLLSGVSGLLAPQQELEEDDQDPRVSFSFSGVQNTTRAGTSVPIVYGEIVTGSVVISAGIDTDQVHA